jgi:hypothetical protein
VIEESWDMKKIKYYGLFRSVRTQTASELEYQRIEKTWWEGLSHWVAGRKPWVKNPRLPIWRPGNEILRTDIGAENKILRFILVCEDTDRG